MAHLEIERRFNVSEQTTIETLVSLSETVESIVQYYLVDRDGHTARVRQTTPATYKGTTLVERPHESKWTMTIKSPVDEISAREEEVDITAVVGFEMAKRTIHAPVVKVRHKIPYGGLIWEVDQYHKSITDRLPIPEFVAEVEIPNRDTQIDIPTWIGNEIHRKDSKINLSNVSIARMLTSSYQK